MSLKNIRARLRALLWLGVAGIGILVFVRAGTLASRSGVALRSLADTGTYRILCLGDATTFGSNYTDAYPRQLEEILNRAGRGLRFAVINKGISSADSSYILMQLADNLTIHRPDMVVVMMGINDGVAGSSYAVGPGPHEGSGGTLSAPFADLTQQLRDQVVPPAGEARINVRVDDSSGLKSAQACSQNELALLEMGQHHHKRGEYAQAEAMFKGVLALNPRNYWAYVRLGENYARQGDYPAAEKMLRKAIGLDLRNTSVLIALGEYIARQGRLTDAAAALGRAIAVNPKDDRAYGHLAVIYQKQGKNMLAQQYFRKADAVRLQWINPITAENYRRLWEELSPRGIRLVSVQYPMRSSAPLRRILRHKAGVVFVDNGRLFKNALKSSRYEELFIDQFAGDFGHCAERGNRLLAENVAAAILRECFR